jgi:hypothetical protein
VEADRPGVLLDRRNDRLPTTKFGTERAERRCEKPGRRGLRDPSGLVRLADEHDLTR